MFQPPEDRKGQVHTENNNEMISAQQQLAEALAEKVRAIEEYRRIQNRQHTVKRNNISLRGTWLIVILIVFIWFLVFRFIS